jgi:hypothetical protein
MLCSFSSGQICEEKRHALFLDDHDKYLNHVAVGAILSWLPINCA